MSEEQRRGIPEFQKSLDELSSLIKELHQRQNDVVMVSLGKIEKCLYGNGKIGLLTEHAICSDRLKGIEKMKAWVVGNFITILVMILGFAVGYGGILAKVEFILKQIGG